MSITFYFFKDYQTIKEKMKDYLSKPKAIAEIFKREAVFTESVFAGKTLNHYLLEEKGSCSSVDFLTYREHFKAIYPPFLKQEHFYGLLYSFLLEQIKNQNFFVVKVLSLNKENLLYDIPRVASLIRDYETYLPHLFERWQKDPTSRNEKESVQRDFYDAWYQFLLKDPFLKDSPLPYGATTKTCQNLFSYEYQNYDQFHFILPLWASVDDLEIVYFLSFYEKKDIYIYLSCHDDMLAPQRNEYHQWIYDTLKQKEPNIKRFEDHHESKTQFTVYEHDESSHLKGFYTLQEELEQQYLTLYEHMIDKDSYVHESAIMAPINPEYMAMIKYTFSKNDDTLKTHFLQYEALENQDRLFFTKLLKLFYHPFDTQTLIDFIKHPWVSLKMNLEKENALYFYKELEYALGSFWEMSFHNYALKNQSRALFFKDFIDLGMARDSQSIDSVWNIHTIITLEFINQMLMDSMTTLRDIVNYFVIDNDIDPLIVFDIQQKVNWVKDLKTQNPLITLKDEITLLQIFYEIEPKKKQGFSSSLIKKISVGSLKDLIGSGLNFLQITQFNSKDPFFPKEFRLPEYHLRYDYDLKGVEREKQILWIRFLDLLHHSKEVVLSFTEYDQNKEKIEPHAILKKIVSSYPVKKIALKDRKLLETQVLKPLIKEGLKPRVYRSLEHFSTGVKNIIQDKDLYSLLKDPFYSSIYQNTGVKPKVSQYLYDDTDSFPLWFLGDRKRLKDLYRYSLLVFFKLQDQNHSDLKAFASIILDKVAKTLKAYSYRGWESFYQDNPYNHKQIEHKVDHFCLMINDYYKDLKQRGYKNYHQISYGKGSTVTGSYVIDGAYLPLTIKERQRYFACQLKYVSLKVEDESILLNLLLPFTVSDSKKKYSALLEPFVSSLLVGLKELLTHHKEVLVLSFYFSDLKKNRIEKTIYDAFSITKSEILTYLETLVEHYENNSLLIPFDKDQLVSFILKYHTFSVPQKIEALKKLYEDQAVLNPRQVKLERVVLLKDPDKMIDLIQQRYFLPLKANLQSKTKKDKDDDQ